VNTSVLLYGGVAALLGDDILALLLVSHVHHRADLVVTLLGVVALLLAAAVLQGAAVLVLRALLLGDTVIYSAAHGLTPGLTLLLGDATGHVLALLDSGGRTLLAGHLFLECAAFWYCRGGALLLRYSLSKGGALLLVMGRTLLSGLSSERGD